MVVAGVPLFSCTWLHYPPSTAVEVIQNIRGYDGKMADVWSAGEHRGSLPHCMWSGPARRRNAAHRAAAAAAAAAAAL